jgi:hypothetical protein
MKIDHGESDFAFGGYKYKKNLARNNQFQTVALTARSFLIYLKVFVGPLVTERSAIYHSIGKQ